jgi:hypothetical protein
MKDVAFSRKWHAMGYFKIEDALCDYPHGTSGPGFPLRDK